MARKSKQDLQVYQGKVVVQENNAFKIDPENIYDFKEDEKEYIRLMLIYNDLYIIAKVMLSKNYITLPDDVNDLSMIDPFSLLAPYMSNDNIKQEISRLELERFKAQKNAKIMSYEEIGSYISSLISGELLSYKNKLSPQDKIKALKLLLEWYENRENVISNNSDETFDYSLDEQLHELSIDTIKNMISNIKNNKGKKYSKNYDDMPNDELLKEIGKLSK